MGHVYTHGDARASERMLGDPKYSTAMAHEHWLMMRLLRPLPGQTGLDIGCGAGHGLMTLCESGLLVTGLDASPHMLRIAAENLGHRAELYRGVAEELPFEDNAFTYACLNRTLEFVEDPLLALAEAFRVTKDRVFIGITNKYSSEAARLCLRRRFIDDPYREARFFSIWEIKRMVRTLACNVPIYWQTYYPLPYLMRKATGSSRPLRFRDPIGPYIGIVVELSPRFMTRLLKLRKCPNQIPGTATGLARVKWSQDERSVSLRKTG